MDTWDDTWETRVHGTQEYMGYMGYKDAGYRDTRRQGYGDTPHRIRDMS